MGRSLGVVLLSLAVGAGVMYAASHFRFRVEPVGEPPAVAAGQSAADPPAVVRYGEPERLPERITQNNQAAGNDTAVRPAVWQAPPVPTPPPTTAQPAPAPPEVVRIASVGEEIGGRTAVWDAATNREVRVNARGGGKVTLYLAEKAKAAPVVFVNRAKFPPVAPNPDPPGVAAVDLTNATTTGQVVVTLKDAPANTLVRIGVAAADPSKPPTEATSDVVLITPGPKDGAEARVLVTDSLDSPFLAPFTPVTGAVTVVNGYLRLKGRALGGPPEFFLLPGETGAGAVTPLPQAVQKSFNPNTGDWEYALDLGPKPTDTRGSLLVRTVAVGEGHFYAAGLVGVVWQARVTPAVPAFADADAVVGGRKDEAAPTLTYRTNAREFNVQVKRSGDAQALLLYVGDRPDPAAARVDPKVDPVVFAKVAVPGDGDHVLTLAAANGKEVQPQRAALTVKVRSAGPQVASVSAPGFGSAAGRQTITVQFRGEELDPKSANKDNFTLIFKGLNGETKAVTPVVVKDPYNKAANTITLAYEGIAAGSYTLTVSGKKDAVVDVFGNSLVVPNAAPGSDFTFDLTAAADAAAALPSQAAGVTLQTGPYVPYHEYTALREMTEGFNPSDRVETRVVRLYYNRDAHRVAQIVNRDVKSYNAATVDVRRRAADRARDDADKATDERKRLEREAVRAFEASRTAEKDLQAALDRSAEARTRAAQASVLVTQRQSDLLVAQRELQRAIAEAGPQNLNDAAVTQYRQRVADAQVQLSVAQQTKAAAEANADVESPAAQKQLDDTRRLRDQADQDYLRARDELRNFRIANPGIPPDNARLQGLQSAAEKARAQLSAEQDNLRQANGRLTELTRQKAAAAAAAVNAQDQLDQAKRNLARAEAEAATRNQPELLAEAQRQQVRELERQLAGFRQVIATGDATEAQVQAAVTEARGRVAAAREAEARATEAWQAQEQQELRAKQNQFRREVAAAREDPDTYAPGKPDSYDPVQQCSISVVGEGLIQIRGPIKGLNIIRLMVNQLDAPVGQVKVGIHTVQVNGEHGDRMERVVANIQRYIDHSRFLTAQSSQMLRKAITLVAARKAEEAAAQLGPSCTQADRDLKYLHAFYGKDFVDELKDLDSEFLKTGNKLLSLNSMDSTSLAAALFQMALAKNTVRAEIVREFQALLQNNLPQAEQSYYMAGMSGGKCCEACCDKKHYCMAYNARFQSFLGFFDSEIPGDDTLTPLQREFIRLAQIFKARLVTELQLNQRVMERSLLEERIGASYLDELRKAKALEDYAKAEFDKVQKLVADERAKMFAPLNDLGQVFGPIQVSIRAFELASGEMIGLQRDPHHGVVGYRTLRELDEAERKKSPAPPAPKEAKGQPGQRPQTPLRFVPWDRAAARETSTTQEKVNRAVKADLRPEWLDENGHVREPFRVKYLAGLGRLNDLVAVLDQFRFVELKDDYDRVVRSMGILNLPENQAVETIPTMIERYVLTYDAARAVAAEVRADYDKLVEIGAPLFASLADQDVQVKVIADEWTVLRSHLTRKLTFINNGALRSNVTVNIDNVDAALRKLQQAEFNSQIAKRAAEKARRPLDEKKLLDMLVDEMEDKLIEQLEGTRAHTANIDNYIKSLSTALEDDFNTQFYAPAFRKIREASRYWDVTLGQVETTTVLANNRAFAKVDPAATFEFDLPKRNIMITEGFQAAKAMMDEYGALLTDPTFLALTKLYSGQPLTAQHGTGGALSPVRNVLPGLPTSSDEMILAQAGPGRKEFGSALEALIPDPAIYKFETGTGFEIRPVLSPDGQAMVFNFNYMYTTDVREPVRAGEKHLGRVKRHFVNTDVQLSNYELREVSTYRVGLKAARTAKGVPLLQDIPGVGLLFRPLPSAESALQENLIYAQGTIFPTLFDLMGLRYAPAVADLDPLAEKNDEWVVRNRRRDLEQRIYDYGAAEVDKALRIPTWEQRPDLYRPQVTIPHVHPNGYYGPGLKLKDSHLREGALDTYDVRRAFPEPRFAPGSTSTAPPVNEPYPGAPRLVPGPPPVGPPAGYLPPPTVQAVPGGVDVRPAPPPSYPPPAGPTVTIFPPSPPPASPAKKP